MVQFNSFQEPCPKCQKKYPNQENWTPCKNCPWFTKQDKTEENLKNQKKEKICLECQENLNFLEPEPQQFLCGKNKCLRSYIERKSSKNSK